MTDDIPPWVSFVNETVERVAREFRNVVDQLATKAELELVTYKLEQEIAERARAIAHERRARETLASDLERDETKRHTKTRRLWIGAWSVMSFLILAATSIVAAIISIH